MGDAAGKSPDGLQLLDLQQLPLNQYIHIGRTRFRVIGVMEKQGGSFLRGPNFDRQIYIPITS
ncbi:hypothetical protein COW53_00700 [bacterium CG17_big_fil_post_rev_8_21_14_2_50_64_8]|nr:MAG: hypothetical protein COW53_00700 [bacterium CG17_big_fil_post_rev_8_21_14_2_50_64_8]PJA74272.1 MAG: hypothetical protein CO151_10250 [bacterium CG_4_9_14_3_um_filter_65_15]